MYIEHESYAKWVLGVEPHMWKMRCLQYFLRRMLDLERILMQGRELGEATKETRWRMSNNLVGEMACEERNVVEECRAETRQKVR